MTCRRACIPSIARSWQTYLANLGRGAGHASARPAATHRLGRPGRGGRRPDGLRAGAASELLRLPGRRGRGWPRSPTTPGRCWSLAFDPISLGLLKRPGDYGADIVGGRRAIAGHPDAVRRAVPGHHGLPRAVRAPHAGPDRRPDGRPPRPALLGADAANPRAAHPPREGHEQHLHEPGAVRLAGRGLPGGDGAAGPARDGRAVPAEGALRRRADRRPASVSSWRSSGPTFKEFVVRDRRRHGRRAAGRGRARRGYPRRRAAGPLVSRTGRLLPGRRDREADARRRSTGLADVPATGATGCMAARVSRCRH